MRRNVESVLQAVFLVVSLVMLGLVAGDLHRMPRAAQGEVAREPALPEAPADLPAASVPFPAIDTYAAIVARPLFTPDRRHHPVGAAPAESAQSVPAGTADRGEMILTGVAIDGTRTLAILESARGKLLHRLAVGESINGWTLTDIRGEAVTLTKGREIMILELRIKGSPPASRRMARRASQPESPSADGRSATAPAAMEGAENAPAGRESPEKSPKSDDAGK